MRDGPEVTGNLLTALPQPSGSGPCEISPKRLNGVYYTPREVARLLTHWAVRSPTDRVLEPSFGGCAFLSETLRRLESLGSRTPHKQLFGCDVDPVAFNWLDALDPKLQPTGHFLCRDFLLTQRSDFGTSVDVIIGNPPFVPYRRMHSKQKSAIEAWLLSNTTVADKDSSLWYYFIVHAFNFLEIHGRMAWIVPNSFLHSRYGEALQTLLRSRFKEVQVIAIQEQLFLHAGTRERIVFLFCSGFLSASRVKATPSSTLLTTRPRSLKEASTLIRGKFRTPRVAPEDFSVAESLVSRVLATHPYVALRSISKVLIGEVIGDAPFFVRKASEWSTLGIPNNELKPILLRSSYVKGLKVTRSRLSALIENDARCLLLHPGNPPSPATSNLLKAYDAASRRLNVTFGKRAIWYLSTYDTSADAFLPSVSSGSTRLVINSANISAANSQYRIHLHPGHKQYARALCLFIQTSLGQLMLELLGAPMGEGALKLNPNQVGKLPILADALIAPSVDIFRRVDSHLAAGNADLATRCADDWILEACRTLEIADITDALVLLRRQRQMQKSPHL